jgi:hypothetical protein
LALDEGEDDSSITGTSIKNFVKTIAQWASTNEEYSGYDTCGLPEPVVSVFNYTLYSLPVDVYLTIFSESNCYDEGIIEPFAKTALAIFHNKLVQLP